MGTPDETRYEGVVPIRRRPSALVLAVLIGAVSGAGAFAAVAVSSDWRPPSLPRPSVEPAADAEDEKPYYAKLPKLMVNINGGKPNVVQASITLKFASATGRDSLKAALPAVRHLTLMFLAAQDADRIADPKKRVELAQELQEKLNILLGLDEDRGVEEVLFDEFMLLP